MNAHTPGPWRVGDAGHTIFGPKEADGKLPQRIGEVCGVRESYLANARLIAAAPEMLAALRAVWDQLRRGYSLDVDSPLAHQISAAIVKVQP